MVTIEKRFDEIRKTLKRHVTRHKLNDVILIDNIYSKDDGKFLTRHAWIIKTKAFGDNINIGDCIIFNATIKMYHRNNKEPIYMKDLIDTFNRNIDYGFFDISDVTKVIERPAQQLCVGCS